MSVEPSAEPAWLEGLNSKQREAVLATEGSVLILAGAGTGKTRALTTRIAWIVNCGLARSQQILAVTFTNRAANEMCWRAICLLHPEHDSNGTHPNKTLLLQIAKAHHWIGTYHSTSLRMLRSFPEAVGLKPDFVILDGDDQLRLMKQVAAELNIDPKTIKAKDLLKLVLDWKDLALEPKAVARTTDAPAVPKGKAEALYTAYNKRLLERNACDFTDLILHVVRVFQADPERLQEWQSRFRYVLVDEYQDINTVQYLWMRLLASGHKNLCVVGDDDQTIYTWRGAKVENILHFPEKFPGTQKILLEENYRSTKCILRAAGGLISHNIERTGKTLFGHGADGDPIRIARFGDDHVEARFIVEEISALQMRGHSLAQIAILVRTVAQMLVIEDRLFADSVPYQVIGGTRFYERAEIRDAVAYLRLLKQDADDLAFERICNVPTRGIGKTTLTRLRDARRTLGGSLPEVGCKLVGGGTIRGAPARALTEFLGALKSWREATADMPPAVAAKRVLEASGYLEMWRNHKDIESPDVQERSENLDKLISALEDYDTIESFLEHVSLVTEKWSGGDEDRVSLTTLHRAKGLEFDSVFLPGWEQGLLPHSRSITNSHNLEDSQKITILRKLEEERRLAYVGITRARKRVWISYAKTRRVHGEIKVQEPSAFLGELPIDCLETTGGGRPTADFEPPVRAPAPNAYIRKGIDRPAAPQLKKGARVRHQSFGVGEVVGQKGELVQVRFDGSGEKSILAHYLTEA